MSNTEANQANRQRWFRPPRPHGESIEDRSVSFVELFYDLVFVVLVAEIAHTLADHVTWIGVRDFVVVFSLIWIAWINGTLYHDLHGGEDGRSRTYIFLQMSILVLLAVFAAHATDDAADGRGFAIVYTILLICIAWQWFDVRRFDTPEWRAIAARYVFGMVVLAGIVLASAFVSDPETRVLIWAAAVALTLIGNLAVAVVGARDETITSTMRPAESLVERFGLFTILVLGEVVVGVADGLSSVDHTALAIVTGILALWIGFGFWWNYFDFVGGRQPGTDRSPIAWMYSHLPMTISISAAGAAMVGLVEHAGDSRTPAATAWLLGGATCGFALSVIAINRTVDSHPGRQAVPYTLLAAAVGALVLASLRPAPWLLAGLTSMLLSAVWLESFIRHTRHGVMITDRV